MTARLNLPRTIFWIFIYSLSLTPCLAQTAATGAILGAVTDPTGAAVVGAGVELVNSATGVKSAVATGAEGQYAFPGVNPGT